MSGRPYARNPRAPYAGPTDLQAVLPHHFRVQAPRTPTAATQLAIRRAIRRRCMEKNWKKMISMRHRRLVAEEAAANPPPAIEEHIQSSPVDQKDGKNGKAAAKDTVQPAEEKEDVSAKEEEAVIPAKQQLERLQQQLQALTDQKHAKFQLLKEILVQEARSKISGASSANSSGVTPPAASNGSASVPKKRRVEFKCASASPPKPATQSINDQNPATLLSPPPAAVMAQSPESGTTSSSSATPGSRPSTML